MRLKGIYNEKEILYNEFVPYRRKQNTLPMSGKATVSLVFEKQKEGFL